MHLSCRYGSFKFSYFKIGIHSTANYKIGVEEQTIDKNRVDFFMMIAMSPLSWKGKWVNCVYRTRVLGLLF